MVSSDLEAFQQEVNKAKNVLILTGAGASAESGVPTFRGQGGLWRRWQAQDLATLEYFNNNPSLVWEYYHYRREIIGSKTPNRVHKAMALFEERMEGEEKNVAIVTQNNDDFHARAGSKNVIELHGSLFKTKCTECGNIRANRDSPICESLRGREELNPTNPDAKIPIDQLPTCLECGGLLRPNVVWFGETLDDHMMARVEKLIKDCDLCLIVGTSSVVYPSAKFAPDVAARGITVAEFNMERTPATDLFKYHFRGPAGKFVPQALCVEDLLNRVQPT